MRWETKSSCPDSPANERLVELLGKDVLAEDGTDDRERMAEKILQMIAYFPR